MKRQWTYGLTQGWVTVLGGICPFFILIFSCKGVNLGKICCFFSNLAGRKTFYLDPFCTCSCSKPTKCNIPGKARVTYTLACRGLTLTFATTTTIIAYLSIFPPFLHYCAFPPKIRRAPCPTWDSVCNPDVNPSFSQTFALRAIF